MQKFIVNITNKDKTLIQDANLECFIIDSSLPETEIKELVNEIKDHHKLFLMMGENVYDACKKYDADGVLVDLSKSEHCAKDVNFARKQIGDRALGVISRNRRHESMLISECEPDFVAFKVWNQGLEQTAELVSWYNEMFLIQSAVILQEPITDLTQFECDIVVGKAENYRER